MAVGDLSRVPVQPDRAVDGLFRISDGGEPCRPGGAEAFVKRVSLGRLQAGAGYIRDRFRCHT